MKNIPPATELEQLAVKYIGWEKHLGTNRVTTGAFSAAVRDAVDALRPNLGAFGRLRTAHPFTLFDGKTLLDANPRDWDDTEAAGTGTGSTFNQNRASTTLSVSGSTAGTRVRQTFRRFAYIPGKSQLALITFVHGALAEGINRKIGLFDDENGIFLDTSGGTVRITRRTYTSGSAVDNVVPQADWNLDRLDGTGPSGLTLDLTKCQIFVIDYEWLGVGRVRVGFDINGMTIYTHEFVNANNLNAVYMSTPNLPLRYEIENTGTGGAAELEAICSTVISEGGEDPVGRQFAVANTEEKTGINGSGATRYALLGVRIASTNAPFGTVQPVRFAVTGDTANDVFAWELVLGGTVAGSPTWTPITNSVAEWYDGDSDTTITGGTIVATGVAISRAPIVIDTQNIPGPGVARDGTPQELHVVIRPYDNMQAIASLNWVER